jgi:hypothetical protein
MIVIASDERCIQYRLKQDQQTLKPLTNRPFGLHNTDCGYWICTDSRLKKSTFRRHNIANANY